MFDLVYDTLFFASNSNALGISNAALSPFDIMLTYIIAIVISIVVALIL